jgi:lipopolysaccharide export system protein LptA
MKRSEAAKYARWSAAAALLLTTLTVGVYLERKWVAHREKEKAPPPAPKGVTRQESGLTFSKGVGAQKLFTVEASKATDFKDGVASLLEDVKITIFGKTGERYDRIHTQSCKYQEEGASIVCNGEVQIDLQSATDAARLENNVGKQANQKVHIETRGVVFSRATGIARSEQPVKFSFPNGRGEAVGVEYRSEEGAITLERDVRFFLLQPVPSGRQSASGTSIREPVRVTGKSVDFGRDSRILHLHGPVEAQTGTARLVAGELTLALDKTFRAEKLVATRGNDGKEPELDSRGMNGQTDLSGETLTAYFAPEGWLTRIEGAGGVQGSQRSANDSDEFSAETASLELRPKVNQPKVLNLKGNVQLKAKGEKTGESRTLQTSALLVEFAEREKGQSSKVVRAETQTRGTLEWTDAAPQAALSATAAQAGLSQTSLTADKLVMEFGAEGRARQLVATSNVVTDRTLPGHPAQSAAAQNGVAQLLESGGWSQMELQGEVKLKEGDKNGQADCVVIVRSAQTATLTGKAVVRDSTTETTAPRITFVQNSGEIRAEGGVRSTDFSAKSSSLQLGTTPVDITADTLLANSKTGRAFYSGHARLWQGDSLMEADSIELLRETRVLNAWGNVRAVFPQIPGQVPEQVLAVQRPGPRKARLWHVTAGTLTYQDMESRAHLEKNVVAQSAEQKMRAPIVDLFFTRSVKTGATPASAASGTRSSGSTQQISRAVGTGGVTVEQGTRKATADRGEYSAADGKFLMSGGNPTIFDASEGTTTGRQLTFFLADDTIIVDSENGSRTLTKHRVEK